MGRRGSFRTEWVTVVAAAEVGSASKALLLYLASRMSADGYVEQIGRDELARLFRVHPQRIAERLGEAVRVGLIERVDGTGTRGQRSRYRATLPHCVPASGTQWVPESSTSCVPDIGTHEGGFVTGEQYAQIGTHESAFRTAERYTQRARVTKASRKRDDNERDVGVSPDHVVTQDSSDEEAPAHSPLAADSPWHAPARDDDPVCGECQRRSAFGSGPCPQHRAVAS